jgi:hypothetical protein
MQTANISSEEAGVNRRKKKKNPGNSWGSRDLFNRETGDEGKPRALGALLAREAGLAGNPVAVAIHRLNVGVRCPEYLPGGIRSIKLTKRKLECQRVRCTE